MQSYRMHLLILFLSCLTIAIQSNTYEYEELPFVILICSYNTAEWVAKNLTSIVMQEYTNYRIVYVDDGSTDGTADIVEYYAKELGLSDKLTLIRNLKRRRKLANMYDAIHTFSDHEIVMLLDGDDWLENDPTIFKKINGAYHTHDSWFVYSQYRNEPKSEAKKWGFRELGYSAPVPARIKKMHAYRNHTFVFMHLRTFYAWLFKHIKLEDLIAHTVPGYKGDFYPAANDVAIVFPMIEMAGSHVHFLKDILYVRNVYSSIVGFKVDNPLQIASSTEIRRRQPYQPLSAVQRAPAACARGPIDACIFFDGDIPSILKTIHSLRMYNKDVRRIIVLYQPTRESIASIREIQKIISIIPCAYDNGIYDCAHALKTYCSTSNTRYLLMCTDIFNPNQSISLKACMRSLEKTGAHGCYFSHEKPTCNIVCDGMGVLHSEHVSKKWQTPHMHAWGLYRAQDVIELFANANINSLATWKIATIKKSTIGLVCNDN